MKVLLDTNFLIDSVRFRINLEDIIDLIGAHDLVTLSAVERELIKLSRTSKTSMHARAAIKMIKDRNMKILKSEMRPDEAMVMFADDETIVATNDIKLRKRLKALGRKTIYLKSKKHLAIG